MNIVNNAQFNKAQSPGFNNSNGNNNIQRNNYGSPQPQQSPQPLAPNNNANNKQFNGMQSEPLVPNNNMNNVM